MLKSTRLRIIDVGFVTGNAEVVTCCSTPTSSPRPFNGKSETGLVEVLPTCSIFLGRQITILHCLLCLALWLAALNCSNWVDKTYECGPGLLETGLSTTVIASSSSSFCTDWDEFEIASG
jgi:hypothetical protein